MFLDKNCEFLGWPTIWFGHSRGTPPAGIRLSILDYINSEIRRYDRRACRADYLLFQHRKCQLHQLTSQKNIVLRKSAQTGQITAGQVRDKQFIDNAVNNDSAYRFMQQITATPAYFQNQKRNLCATIRQQGSYTLFLSHSSAETRWPELLVILKKTVDKTDITEDEAKTLTFEEKARLISTDPVTCAQYMNHRLKELFKLHNAQDGPFGKYPVDRIYKRIEFQHRGSGHGHIFIGLKDVPKFEPDDPDSFEPMCAFADEILTTDSDDPEVADIIYVQRHRCTHTCRKGKRDKEVCRFDAPWPPMERTRILMPIPQGINMTKEKIDELKALYKKLREILESDQDEMPATLDEVIERLGCNLDDYLLAIRLRLKRPKLFLKRLPKNGRINQYIKKLLIAMRSNMDANIILDDFACVSYVVDYVNKSDRGLSRLLRQCVEEHRRGNQGIKAKLSALSKILYNSSEISAQEAAWIRLRQPMCTSTDVVEFISSGPKSVSYKVFIIKFNK